MRKPKSSLLTEVARARLKQGGPVDVQNWRGVQADHNERMAKLSDAYAAAYEGDVQFAVDASQRFYLVRRARRHRQDAAHRRAAAQKLRATTAARSA